MLAGHDPAEVLAFCQTLSPEVKLVRGYQADDFTMLMYKDSKSGHAPKVAKLGDQEAI